MTIPLNDLASASEPFGEADTLLASGTFSALVHVVAGSSHDPLGLPLCLFPQNKQLMKSLKIFLHATLVVLTCPANQLSRIAAVAA